jgi:hypothetical protein
MARAGTFIKVTEIWVPDGDERFLRLESGIYGEHECFREAAKLCRFKKGEGLPGQAWAEQRPVILRDFSEGGFRRADEAQAAGLTCGVALPVFCARKLVAVVIFFCGGGEAEFGAIEVWRQSERFVDSLVLEDGHYGSLEALDELSRGIAFRRGDGLPGVVWEVERPCIMANIGENGAFFRSSVARRSRLSSALGIPCSFGGDEISVLCLLSARTLPIARRYEIWVPVTEGRLLRRAFAVNDGEADDGAESPAARVAPGEGPIGRVWKNGIPLVCGNMSDETSVPVEKAVATGLSRMVALATYKGTDVSAIVAWYY